MKNLFSLSERDVFVGDFKDFIKRSSVWRFWIQPIKARAPDSAGAQDAGILKAVQLPNERGRRGSIISSDCTCVNLSVMKQMKQNAFYSSTSKKSIKFHKSHYELIMSSCKLIMSACDHSNSSGSRASTSTY